MTPERREEIGLMVYDFEREQQDKLIKKQGYPETNVLIEAEAFSILKLIKKKKMEIECVLEGLTTVLKIAKQKKIDVDELIEYLVTEDRQTMRRWKSGKE